MATTSATFGDASLHPTGNYPVAENEAVNAPQHPRGLVFAAAVLPSLAMAGLLLLLLPGVALAAAGAQDGATPIAPQALVQQGLAGPSASAPRNEAIVVAAKDGRLLKNGTRSRSNEDADKNNVKPAEEGGVSTDAVKTPAAAGPSKPVPAAEAAAKPTAAPTAPAQAAAATPEAKPSPAVAQAAPSGSTECLAGCNVPVQAAAQRGTGTAMRANATVQMTGTAASAATEGGTTCIAGCYGLNSGGSGYGRQHAHVAAPALETTAGTANAGNGRITVLRGNTRKRVYGVGD